MTMLNLLIKVLELGTKNRGVKDYKILSIDQLLSIVDKSEQVKILKLSEI